MNPPARSPARSLWLGAILLAAVISAAMAHAESRFYPCRIEAPPNEIAEGDRLYLEAFGACHELLIGVELDEVNSDGGTHSVEFDSEFHQVMSTDDRTRRRWGQKSILIIDPVGSLDRGAR